MDINAAKQFIIKNARPLDLAVYEYFFNQGSNQAVVNELAKYQNEDGGFGHGLELDYWNPNSSPIATNDAIITLFRINALETNSQMIAGIVAYLESLDSFDQSKKRWLFAIESNKDYPHAFWWEKVDDGIHGFNPTMSLAAVGLCFGKRTALYEKIIKEGYDYLATEDEISGDALKCFLLAYELLKVNGIDEIIDLDDFQRLISKRINETICKDLTKYGIEYVPMPSDFFVGTYLEFITPEMRPLIQAEKDILGQLQQVDGGFDISWQWNTPYAEFEQARNWWRPRLTIDKLLFWEIAG